MKWRFDKSWGGVGYESEKVVAKSGRAYKAVVWFAPARKNWLWEIRATGIYSTEVASGSAPSAKTAIRSAEAALRRVRERVA